MRLAPLVHLADLDAPPPDAPPGALVLRQRPSRAFGDGTHPTTRLCARAVDLHARLRAPRAVLDVGTGTGVLARIARAHGAARVVGVDVDPLALAAARANAALDAHPIDVVERIPAGERFDLVVANIVAEVLHALVDELAAAVAPGGALLLSGFTPPQGPALRAAFAARGLVVEQDAVLDGWALAALRRPGG